MNVGCNNRMRKCNKVQINHDGPEASVEFGNGAFLTLSVNILTGRHLLHRC